MVTVHEVMSLEHYKNFKLVAGIGGLDRKVARAGFIDHEGVDDIRAICLPGEMIFSNLVQIKDQPEMLYPMVEALIEAQVSCFALKTIFFKAIPEDVVELANKNKFPIFLFEETYIELLILDVDAALNKQKVLDQKVDLVNEILTSNLDVFGIRSLVTKLNRQFKSCMTVLYIEEKDTGIYNMNYSSIEQILGKASMYVPYETGHLIFLSYDYSENIDIESTLISTGLVVEGLSIGISQSKDNLGEVNHAIDESMIACRYALLKNNFKSYYDDIGIFKLLIPILNDRISYRYYNEIISRLSIYDLEHKSDLLNTARHFVAMDGNIKNTADQLFQHPNTLRYRIKKIYEVLELDMLAGMQYETLAIAIHLYNLNR